MIYHLCYFYEYSGRRYNAYLGKQFPISPKTSQSSTVLNSGFNPILLQLQMQMQMQLPLLGLLGYPDNTSIAIEKIVLQYQH